MAVVFALLLIRAESGDFAPLGAFVEQRDEVGHEVEFLHASGFPVQAERFHQVGELLAIEDHALQDAVHEGLQGGGGQSVLAGDGGEFRALPSPP